MKASRIPVVRDRALPIGFAAEPPRPNVAALVKWFDVHRAEVEEALREVGGVLIRGIELFDEDAFEQAATAYLKVLWPYVEGQSPRTKVRASGVYTSTEYPKSESIPLHHELSYAARPPHRILFFCQSEATVGGETPIVDGREIVLALDPAVREPFEALGVLYVKYMHGDSTAALGRGKSWQDHFETEDREAVAAYLRAGEVEFEWHDDNGLTTRQRRPAFVPHHHDGRPVWFNQASLWHLSNFPKRVQANLRKLLGEDRLPTQAYFGNGDPIPDDAMDHVRRVCLDASTRFRWQRGDLLILDNLTVAHGRTPFAGPRRILVAMG